MVRFHSIFKGLKRKDCIIALIILSLPFFYRIYRLFPNVEIFQTNLFVINPEGFGSIRAFFWLIVTRLSLIIVLIIWYRTCKHWWRKAILIPLIIEFFKTINIINNISIKSNKVDEIEYYNSLPIILPIILIIIYFSIRINSYYAFINLRKDLNYEIDHLFNKHDFNNPSEMENIKSLFEELKINKEELTKEEYLAFLLQLRKRLFNLKKV